MPRASRSLSNDDANPYRPPSARPSHASLPIHLTEGRSRVFWESVFGGVVALGGVGLFFLSTCMGIVVFGIGVAALANAKWRAERTVVTVDEVGVTGYVNSSEGPKSITTDWKDVETLCLFDRSWLCLKVRGEFIRLELEGLTQPDVDVLRQAVDASCTKWKIEVMSPEEFRDYNLAH